MKFTSPAQVLAEHLGQLHCMETQLARELPILAGSVMYAPLRRWLSRRAMSARERRDLLETLLIRHVGSAFATKPHDLIGGILTEGNRDLARIHHPCARDAAMIEHCIRIEQHATTTYGIAVPLTNRIGFTRVSEKLKLSLKDLDTARLTFRSLEAEVFSIAANHPFPDREETPPALTVMKRRKEQKTDFPPEALAVGF